MQDLQLIGVHEDGEHLLLSGADDKRFRMPVDEALRTAVRRDRPRLGQQQTEAEGGLRPRDVQALIRAGASTDEAASRAGWSVDKVRRYEGPILAEREHVAGLAQKARLRSPTSSPGGGDDTLSTRVTERLKTRDVEVSDAGWDSWRSDSGPWTVVLTFAAGGRQRQASWSFDLADRTVSAVDDEARWLSEEVQEVEGPIPAPRVRQGSGRESTVYRDSTVYDVEAEGGLRPTAHAMGQDMGQTMAQDAARDGAQDDPLDLMTAMRKRSTAIGRRKPGRRRASGGSPQLPARVPDAEPDAQEQAPPLEGLETVESKPAVDHVYQSERADEGSAVGSLAHPAPPNEAPPDEGGTTEDPVKGPERQDQPVTRPKRVAREGAKKPGRPSVPAWDEIMFGSRPHAR